jgi:hypothetical protein
VDLDSRCPEQAKRDRFIGKDPDHLGAALQLLVEPLRRGLPANQSTGLFQAWILMREDPLDIFNTMEWAKLGSM